MLSEQNKNSFYFDIKITHETNTSRWRRSAISEEALGGIQLQRILGNLHEEERHPCT